MPVASISPRAAGGSHIVVMIVGQKRNRYALSPRSADSSVLKAGRPGYAALSDGRGGFGRCSGRVCCSAASEVSLVTAFERHSLVLAPAAGRRAPWPVRRHIAAVQPFRQSLLMTFTQVS